MTKLATVKDAPNSMLSGLRRGQSGSGKSAFSPVAAGMSVIQGGSGKMAIPGATVTPFVSRVPSISVMSGGAVPGMANTSAVSSAPSFREWRASSAVNRLDRVSSPPQAGVEVIDRAGMIAGAGRVGVSGGWVSGGGAGASINSGIGRGWAPIALSAAFALALVFTGAFAYNQIVQTKASTEGTVAGAVSSQEALTNENIDAIVSAVRSEAVVVIGSSQSGQSGQPGQSIDLSDTPAIAKVVNAGSVRKQNPIFFARVQDGDLLIKFQNYTALYRPSTQEIIAQGSLRVN